MKYRFYFFIYLVFFSAILVDAQSLSKLELQKLSEEIKYPEVDIDLALNYTKSDLEKTLEPTNTKKFQEIIDEAKVNPPKNAKKMKELGEAYLAVNQRENAYTWFLKADTLYVNSLKENIHQYNKLMEYGEMLLSVQNYKSALSMFQYAIEEAPDSAKAWEKLGYCWLFVGDYKNAEIAFKRAIVKDDLQKSEYYIDLASAQMMIGMQAYVASAKQGIPGDFLTDMDFSFLDTYAETYPLKAKILKYSIQAIGIMFEEVISVDDIQDFKGISKKSKNYSMIKEIHSFFIKISKNEYSKQPYVFKVLQVLEFIKGNVESSHENYEKFIQLNSKNKLIYLNQAAIYGVNKQYEKALDVLLEKRKNFPEPDDFLYIARMYFELDRLDKCMETTNEIPYLDFVVMGKAAIYIRQKKYDLAKTELAKILQNTQNYRAKYYQAVYYLLNGDREKAKKTVEEDIETQGNSSMCTSLKEIFFEK